MREVWKYSLHIVFICILVYGASGEVVINIGNAMTIREPPFSKFIAQCCRVIQIAAKDIQAQDVVKGYQFNIDECELGTDGQPRGYNAIKQIFNYTMTGRKAVPIIWYGFYYGLEFALPAKKDWNFISMSPADAPRFSGGRYWSRVVSSSFLTAQAIAAFIRTYKWNTIGVVAGENTRSSDITNELERLVSSSNINISTRIDVTQQELIGLYNNDPTYQSVFLKLKDNYVRILVYVDVVEQIQLLGMLCQLFKMNLYGERYMILLADGFTSFKELEEYVKLSSCTNTDILEVLKGTFSSSLTPITTLPHSHFLSRKTPNDLLDEIKDQPLDFSNFRSRLFSIYDGIWAIALALNATISSIWPQTLDQFEYGDLNYTDVLYNNLMDINFQGMSGQFLFEKQTGDRLQNAYISQYNENGLLVEKMVYSHRDKKLIIKEGFSEKDIWLLRGGKPPAARGLIKTEARTVSLPSSAVFAVFGIICILLALAFLIFMIIKRNSAIMRDNWPYMTACICVGAILLNLTMVIQLVATASEGRHFSYAALCVVQPILLIFGFSMFFGGISLRLCGLYILFKQKYKKQPKEGFLLVVMNIFLIIDAVVVIVWFSTDNMTAKQSVHKTRDPVEDILYHYELTECVSDNKSYYIIGIVCYKSVVLLIGTFIAWPALFVSKKKGMADMLVISTFVTVLSCIIGLVGSFAVSEDPNAIFCVNSFLISLTTILATLLLFIPKAVSAARGDSEITMRFASPLGAAFGFLETMAEGGQLPGLSYKQSSEKH